MKSSLCSDEIFGVPPQMKLNPPRPSPREAGFHREAISSTKGGFLPPAADLTEKSRLRKQSTFFLAGAGGFLTHVCANICGNPSCSLAQTRQIAWQFAGFFMALFTMKKERSLCFRIDFFPFWQGQEDSNPRPTVLETGTLPAELYPCLRRLLAT